jgi:hypothetical protein
MEHLSLTHLRDGRIFHPRSWSILSDSVRIARQQGAISARMLRDALQATGRRAVLRVSSGSMRPTLQEGDKVTIVGTEAGSLCYGDIVVCDSPLAGLIVHRLLWKVPPFEVPRCVYTKGDALRYMDRPFPVQEVLGRVIEIENERGRRRVRRVEGLLKWIGAAARCLVGTKGGNPGQSAESP